MVSYETVVVDLSASVMIQSVQFSQRFPASERKGGVSIEEFTYESSAQSYSETWWLRIEIISHFSPEGLGVAKKTVENFLVRAAVATVGYGRLQ